jgi:MFS family permease
MSLHIQKPFQWANRNTVKTNIIGACVAFWVTFTMLGSNLLVAQKIDESFVFVVVLLLLFHLLGKDVTSFSGIIGRTVSRRTVLFIALAMMTGSTIAVNVANSMGMLTLVYMLMAIGYFPAISITAHLHMDFLSDDKKSQGRGRSFFGSLNFGTSAFGSLAIPLILHGRIIEWSCIAIGALFVATCFLICTKDDLAVKEHPWTVPDRNILPFFPQILNVKSANIPWAYSLVVACTMAARMFPVFFVDKWVAVAMIFCGDMTIAACGPIQDRFSEWVEKKDTFAKKHIVQVVSLGALITLLIAVVLIQTSVATFCIIGAILIGVVNRIFTYLGIILAEQTGRGYYTYFFVSCIGHCFASMMGMVTLTSSMFLVAMPFILIGIYFYAKPLWKAHKE